MFLLTSKHDEYLIKMHFNTTINFQNNNGMWTWCHIIHFTSLLLLFYMCTQFPYWITFRSHIKKKIYVQRVKKLTISLWIGIHKVMLLNSTTSILFFNVHANGKNHHDILFSQPKKIWKWKFILITRMEPDWNKKRDF